MALERRVSATEARVHFGELLREVAGRQQTVVVERGGKPQAVLISVEEYERLSKGQAEPGWEEALARLARRGRRIFNRPEATDLGSPAELIRRMREERDGELGLR